MAVQTLFTGGSLSEVLRRLGARADQLLLDWDPDKLLAEAEADVVALLLDEATIENVSLHRDDAYLLDPTEVSVQTTDWGEQVTRRVTRQTLVVPFSGDPQLLRLQPNTDTTSPPRAEVGSNAIRLFCDGTQTSAQVKAFFDGALDQLDKHLGWSSRDVNQHARQLEQRLPQLVSQRRAKLLADRQVQAAIGFPIRRRVDANAYAVPVRRRRITAQPRQPAGVDVAGFQPEPALADRDYEAAIEVLLNARNALERSPSMTAKLKEEHIRDLLLVSLNAQFEGNAAGEVFNGSGKTDILIREQDRNVFIGECKIWNGPKTITDALDQLLGYMVWRDTKAALLLFIKRGEVTDVTAKAIAKIEEHLNFKRRGKRADEDRHDFVLHANGDPAREIHLALLPILVAPPA